MIVGFHHMFLLIKPDLVSGCHVFRRHFPVICIMAAHLLRCLHSSLIAFVNCRNRDLLWGVDFIVTVFQILQCSIPWLLFHDHIDSVGKNLRHAQTPLCLPFVSAQCSLIVVLPSTFLRVPLNRVDGIQVIGKKRL